MGFFECDAIVEACVPVYFAPVLYGATFGRVALLDNKVVGVIFGSVEGEDPCYIYALCPMTKRKL